MTKVQLPETMTLDKIEALRSAFGWFYDQELNNPFSDKSTGFKFNDVTQYVDYLNSDEVGIPLKTSAKHIGIILEQWYETLTQTPTPEYEHADQTKTPQYESQSQTTITEESNPEAFVEAQKREESARIAEQKAKEDVQRGMERQQQIYEEQQKIREQIRENKELKQKIEELQEKDVYVKVEEKPIETDLPEEKTKILEDLKQAAIENQQETTKQLAEEIKSRIADTTPPEIVDSLSNQTALYTVGTLTGDISYSPTIQQSVVEELSANPETISGILKNPEIANQTVNVINALSTGSQREAYNLSQRVLTSAFGEDFTEALSNQNNFVVSVSTTPEPEYSAYSMSNISDSYSQELEGRDRILEDVKGLAVDSGKTRAVTEFNKYLIGRIDRLPSGHFLKGEFAQNTMSIFGLGAPVNWAVAEGASPIIKLAVSSGYGPVLGTIQSATGWNLGVTKTAVEAGKLALEKGGAAIAGKAAGQAVGQAAVQTATKTGLAATLSTALAGLGAWAGPVGIAIGTAVGTLLGKLLEKIDWAKVKGWLKDNGPIILLGGGLLLGGPAWGIGLGLGGLALAGKFTALGIARGTWRFFRRIGTFFLITIGTPFIVTLLVLPPLIAFIMFVINSGAYLVPPKPVAESGFSPGTGGYECREDRITTGLEYPVNSPIAIRAREIVDDLYQGFWCFWNRSPKAPTPYFPNDEEPNFPPGYPDLFDYEAFLQNPNTTPPSQNLFWCTWLIQKAYTENGVKILNTLWSPDMKLDFESRGKFVPASSVSSLNAVPGSVIFFDVVGNGKDRIDHVGIIYQTNGDDVTYIQSNAGLKVEHLTLGSSGLQGKPGYIDVIGIGLP